ncbi:ABC transporter permease [Oryzicola mucosus]|uniref:ABC transporter permease n=1 Tax=Oryzicola mucosus TaxID=2767425 RepID=A0A8J6PI25_9HYPH|nr:ABC transporter permease [Oryzicola mucosus]MBD0413901.1 ABC transporter permease [Oryzicola mucosus]
MADRRLGRLAIRIAALVLFIGIWQAAGDDSINLLFPTFTRTVSVWWDLVESGVLPITLLITNQTLFVGFLIVLVLGIPIGIFTARIKLMDKIVSPYLTFLVAIPMIAIIPVIQALLGLTFAARVTVVVLFAIPYVVINTAVAVRRVDPVLTEMAFSFGASRLMTLRDVVLPAAVPGMMAGIRIALGQALIGMVVAELTIVGAGIGSLIADLQGRFRVAPVLAVACSIVIEGIILMSLVEWIERRLGRWSKQ